MSRTTPHIFMIAGESSGDQLGASLMHALQQKTHGHVRIEGVGGSLMQAKGLKPLFASSEIALMGPTAIVRNLFNILKRLRQTVEVIVKSQPDILVVIDSPEFTQRVAKRVRQRAPQIRIVKYIAPQVWAWRQGRAQKMRAYIDEILAILPFEPAFYEKLSGPKTTYVGHPLIERDDLYGPDAENSLRWNSDPPLIAVLPGSRISEVTRLLKPFGETLTLLKRQGVDFRAVIPVVPHLRNMIAALTADWPVAVELVEGEAAKWKLFRQARAALAASGTVTLELALAQVPMLVAYKVEAWLAPILRRLIKVQSIVLPNLVLSRNVIPEFHQNEVTAQKLAPALAKLLADTPERAIQAQSFAEIHRNLILAEGKLPSEQAAQRVLGHHQGRM